MARVFPCYSSDVPNEVYRRCASIAVFRPAKVCAPGGSCAASYELLLLHKPRKSDAWQLPQGGCEEGETTQQAAERELKEEAGITADVVGRSAKVYQYDFPPSYRRFRPDNVRGQRIEFVFALLQGGGPIRVDGKEIDAYVWVSLGQIGQYVKRREYLAILTAIVEEARGVLPPQ